jgi:DNA-binding response OmpR family regulator
MEKTVLVVDDNDDLREMLGTFLEIDGWQVFTAASGEEGIIMAEKELPNLILLDVMMPKMDGITMFKHLQSNDATKDIPVIFVSAHIFSQEIIKYIETGIAGVITKPFTLEELLFQIHKILNLN